MSKGVPGYATDLKQTAKDDPQIAKANVQEAGGTGLQQHGWARQECMSYLAKPLKQISKDSVRYSGADGTHIQCIGVVLHT
jgi:hypothetical protein